MSKKAETADQNSALYDKKINDNANVCLGNPKICDTCITY